MTKFFWRRDKKEQNAFFKNAIHWLERWCSRLSWVQHRVLAKLSPNTAPEDFMDTSEVALMYMVDTLKCQWINETAKSLANIQCSYWCVKVLPTVLYRIVTLQTVLQD